MELYILYPEVRFKLIFVLSTNYQKKKKRIFDRVHLLIWNEDITRVNGHHPGEW